MKILAMHIKDDAAFAQQVSQEREEPSVVELLAEDPLFGAVFEDLDQNDQGEYGDIKKVSRPSRTAGWAVTSRSKGGFKT